MIDIESATAFATEWIDAWNAGDMERVLAHYADDCVPRAQRQQNLLLECATA